MGFILVDLEGGGHSKERAHGSGLRVHVVGGLLVGRVLLREGAIDLGIVEEFGLEAFTGPQDPSDKDERTNEPDPLGVLHCSEDTKKRTAFSLAQRQAYGSRNER